MKEDVKVFYVRDAENFPVACVASRFVKMGSGDTFVVYAWSKWNPEDDFDRELGRNYAIGRLRRGQWAGIVRVTESQTKNRILMDLALNHTAIPTPHSLQRAAEQMLQRRMDEGRRLKQLRKQQQQQIDYAGPAGAQLLRSLPEVMELFRGGRIFIPTFALPGGCRDTTEKVEVKSQPQKYPKVITHD